MTALHEAAEQGNLAEVERLLNEGAEVNAENQDGETPLYCAASEGHIAAAELLIENGADVSALNRVEYGRTLLSKAVTLNQTGRVKFLLRHGASIDVGSSEGKRHLHWAAIKGNPVIAQLLIDRGADVNATDYMGLTPLWRAVMEGHKEVAEVLIDKGANLNTTNIEGITLWEYFVNYIMEPDRGNNPNAPDWLFNNPKCIIAILKSTSPEEATRVMNAIFADNTTPKLQKDIFTETLKQYAELLENPDVQPEQRQQLEDAYKAIITAAVQANPNLYDVAHAYCNPLRDLGRKIRGTAVSLVQSYLTTTDDALHDGIKPTTRNQLLTVVEEAAPQQEQPTRNELLTVAEEAVPPQTSVAESSPEKLNEARETTWEDRTNNTQNHSSTPSR